MRDLSAIRADLAVLDQPARAFDDRGARGDAAQRLAHDMAELMRSAVEEYATQCACETHLCPDVEYARQRAAVRAVAGHPVQVVAHLVTGWEETT